MKFNKLIIYQYKIKNLRLKLNKNIKLDKDKIRIKLLLLLQQIQLKQFNKNLMKKRFLINCKNKIFNKIMHRIKNKFNQNKKISLII